jgi:hypothetical protein
VEQEVRREQRGLHDQLDAVEKARAVGLTELVLGQQLRLVGVVERAPVKSLARILEECGVERVGLRAVILSRACCSPEYARPHAAN